MIIDATILEAYHKNRWHRLRLDDGTTAVGFSDATPSEGMRVQLVGEWKTHPKWGRQFEFSSFCSMSIANSEASVVEWLTLFSGIGPAKAKAIYAHFGPNVYEVLKENPKRLLEVPGVNHAVVQAIERDFDDQRSVWAFYTQLGEKGLLGPNSPLTDLMVKKIFRRFGEAGIDTVLYHPYRLTQIHGIGFQIADRIAREVADFEPCSTERIRGAIHFALSEARDAGHACYRFDQVITVAGDALYAGDATVDMNDYDDILEEELRALVRQDSLKQLGEHIYSKHLWEIETDIISRLEGYSSRGVDLPTSEAIALANKVSDKMAEMGGVPLDETQRHAVATTLRSPVSIITGGPGTGKCEARDTPILMYDGTIKLVQDIVEGDEVMGWDSTPRKVWGLDRGQAPLWKVIPTKGEPFTVTQNHILPLKMKKHGRDKTVCMTVDEYNRLPDTDHKTRYKLFRCGIELPEKPITVDPYFLGVWLGDGTATYPTEITTADKEVVAFIEEYARKLDLQVSIVERNLTSPRYRITRTGAKNQLLDQMVDLGLRDNKHVPDQYLRNSREVRLQVLAGLIDTDGYLTCGTYDFITKYPQLRDDMLYLCRSLGLAAYSTECQKGFKREDGTRFVGTYHRISISGDIDQIPCKVARRKAAPRKQVKNVLRTGFTLEPQGVGEYFGFETDGDHIFLLGDFTATHNTTLVKAIVLAAEEMDLKLVLCAPSGKASRRLSEATGRDGQTIHRALEAVAPTDSGLAGHFGKNEENKLDADFVIVDEATMLGLSLFDSLLKAMPDNCRLLLVGDVDQLPSVDPATLFHDLIESKRFPVARLSKVYRQQEGSAIALAAESIKTGKSPDWDVLREEGLIPDEVKFVPVPEALDLPEALVSEALLMVQEGIPFDEVQIIVPQKRGKIGAPMISFHYQRMVGRYRWTNSAWQYVGPNIRIGKRNVPAELQIPLHPEDFSDAELRRRIPDSILVGPGDRVRHTVNNYKLDVFNGDVGVIEEVDPEARMLSVKYPFKDIPIVYEAEYVSQLDLAYAITCHVSQGSEFKGVVVGMSTSYYQLLQRNLFYTAVSRARTKCCVCGTRRAIGIAVRNKEVADRQSLLTQRLAPK